MMQLKHVQIIEVSYSFKFNVKTNKAKKMIAVDLVLDA
jgi:hypothetical protein